MKAKNGIDWNELGFTVYGECPEYHGMIMREKRKTKSNITYTDSYKKWQRLIATSRGQAEDKQATICKEWLEYENYKKWYDENYYSIDGEIMSLSYRIFDLKNHYIAPETCVFVPQRLLKNMLIFRLNDDGFPCGMNLEKDTYVIRLTGYRNGKFSYRTKNYQEALQKYYEVKNEILQELLREYQNRIPPVLYDRLNNFTIKELMNE